MNLTNEEINKLLNRQLSKNHHPLTCLNSHVLYPTEIGWVCGKCSYVQLYGDEEMRIIGRDSNLQNNVQPK